MTRHPPSCQHKQGTIPFTLHPHKTGDLFILCLYTSDILPSFGAWSDSSCIKSAGTSSIQLWPNRHLLDRLCGCLLKPHNVGNSTAKRETWEGNGIRMAMAGEAVRLTEQESGPAFLWCDGKYNNTTSVKAVVTNPHWAARASLPSIHSYMVSQLTTRWVGSSLASIYTFWTCQRKLLWGLNHINFSPWSPLSPSAVSLSTAVSAVNHPASWFSSEGPSWLLPALRPSYSSQ